MSGSSATGLSSAIVPNLLEGGVIRSHGNWSQVVSLRRKGEAVSSDARILGSSDFVDRLSSEVGKKEKETLRLFPGKCDLPVLLSRIAAGTHVEGTAVCTVVRTRMVVYARKLLSQIAVRKMGYSGAEVARFLGITTSAVNRLGQSEGVAGDRAVFEEIGCFAPASP
jgi:putative transposase